MTISQSPIHHPLVCLLPLQFDQEAIEAFAKFKEELKKKDGSAGGTPPASSALSSALAVSNH